MFGFHYFWCYFFCIWLCIQFFQFWQISFFLWQINVGNKLKFHHIWINRTKSRIKNLYLENHVFKQYKISIPKNFEKLLFFGLILAELRDQKLLSSTQITCTRFLHIPQKLAIDLQRIITNLTAILSFFETQKKIPSEWLKIKVNISKFLQVIFNMEM
jgi:hypothetical protein